ncbi:predicted protein [Postia placenta Mad-698-R]|nr:predicted protein [Postia placenta Mad-698-R]
MAICAPEWQRPNERVSKQVRMTTHIDSGDEKRLWGCVTTPAPSISLRQPLSFPIDAVIASLRVAETGRCAFPKPHIPNSFHMEQDELFKVIQGRMCYVCNGKEGVAHTGAVVELPKGAVHTACTTWAALSFFQFWCDPTSEEDVIVEFTARPGRGMDERNINSAYGIFNSYFVAQKPVPFLQDMVIWYEAASAPGHFPKPFAIMAAYMFGGVIGRLAGYRGTYPLYTEQEAGKE